MTTLRIECMQLSRDALTSGKGRCWPCWRPQGLDTARSTILPSTSPCSTMYRWHAG
jgi:hypothetical protein